MSLAAAHSGTGQQAQELIGPALIPKIGHAQSRWFPQREGRERGS